MYPLFPTFYCVLHIPACSQALFVHQAWLELQKMLVMSCRGYAPGRTSITTPRLGQAVAVQIGRRCKKPTINLCI